MLPFTRFHTATLTDLHTWSTLSRNEVRPFLARFGIQPLGTKYPMVRIYEHLLGLSPANAAEDDMLGRGLVRVTKVAERFGVSSDDLLDRLRVTNNDFPPLYAVGPKRHLMLEAQVEQLLSSPNNAFHSLAPILGHALPASRIARTLDVPQSRIDALLKDKDDLPARIITRGRVRYIVSDVANRLTASGSDEGSATKETSQAEEVIDDTPNAAPASRGGGLGGLFADVSARAVAKCKMSNSCTESGANARGGDCLHGTPTEAKLSET